MSSEVLGQATLFFVVFAILSIISLVISRKNAKKYELENPLQERRAKARKEKLIERHIHNSLVSIKGKEYVIASLVKSLEKKIINEEEFEILKLSVEEGCF